MRVLYFAWVREAVGRDAEEVDLPAGIVDIAGLVGYGTALGDLSRLRYAADEVFVGADADISHVREVAIFPPVTGG